MEEAGGAAVPKATDAAASGDASRAALALIMAPRLGDGSHEPRMPEGAWLPAFATPLSFSLSLTPAPAPALGLALAPIPKPPPLPAPGLVLPAAATLARPPPTTLPASSTALLGVKRCCSAEGVSDTRGRDPCSRSAMGSLGARTPPVPALGSLPATLAPPAPTPASMAVGAPGRTAPDRPAGGAVDTGVVDLPGPANAPPINPRLEPPAPASCVPLLSLPEAPAMALPLALALALALATTLALAPA